MIAEDLINYTIPPLKPTDKVGKAMKWMDELRLNELPVIENETYKGLVSEDLIYQYNDEDALIDDLELICKNVYVNYNQHFYEILKLASVYAIQIVAVIGEERNFLGVVTLNDTINAFAASSSLQETGGILILSIHKRDYSLAEISRLVESNGAKILSTFITDDKDDFSRIRVTLKINQENLNPIIATLERFSYQVEAKFQAVESFELDRERIDLLFKYLNI
jgi:acetoin utilization protein AcuB